LRKGVTFPKLINGRRRKVLMKENPIKNAQKNVHHAQIPGHCHQGGTSPKALSIRLENKGVGEKVKWEC
jgi:hypothetical protein